MSPVSNPHNNPWICVVHILPQTQSRYFNTYMSLKKQEGVPLIVPLKIRRASEFSFLFIVVYLQLLSSDSFWCNLFKLRLGARNSWSVFNAMFPHKAAFFWEKHGQIKTRNCSWRERVSISFTGKVCPGQKKKTQASAKWTIRSLMLGTLVCMRLLSYPPSRQQCMEA